MEKIINHLSKLPKISLLVRSYATVFLIALLDYITGPYLSMLVFYLVPIVIVTWFVGRRAGIFISIASALSCSLHDILYFQANISNGGANWLVPVWNPTITLSVFVIVALILAAMKRAEDERIRYEFQVASEVLTCPPKSDPRLNS
jgi:hypothetical protein